MADRKGKVPVGLVILSLVLALVLVNTVVFGWKAFTMEGPLRHILTMDVLGQGVISPGVGTHTYSEGAMAVLEAYPEEGWVFSHWQGPVTEAQTPRTMARVENDDTITAVFVEEQPDYYYLTMKVAGVGAIFPGVGKHVLEAGPQGSPVTLSAVPGEGYHFEGWTSEGEVVSTALQYELLVDRDMALTANFVSHFSVSVSATEGGAAAGGGQALRPGAVAVVRASPDQGYGFQKWTEGGKTVSTDQAYTFTVAGSRSLRAHFLPLYDVKVASKGGGSVSSSVARAMAGTMVHVAAQADPGYAFLRWLEDGVSMEAGGFDLELLHYGSPAYDFKLDRNRNLEAEFVRVFDIDVHVNNKAWGSVKAPATKILAGDRGVVIALSNTGYGFEKWTEDGVVVSTFPIYEFTGERDRTLTAHFIPGYDVTLQADSAAGGTVFGDGFYNKGTEATVRAYPGEMVQFKGWEKDGTIVSASEKYTFTVEDDTALIARFQLPVNVSVKADPAAGGLARAWLHVGPGPEDVVVGGGLYEYGSFVSVEARANLGYRFDRWLEGGALVSGDLVHTFAAQSDRALTAKYSSVDTYEVSGAPSPAEGGSVSGSGVYNEGAEVTVLALAKPGYRFVDWREEGLPVSGDRNYTFTLDGDRSLVANFQRTYPVQVSADPEVAGKVTGVGFYRIGESVTVEAKPSFGYRFDCWIEGGATVSSDSVYSFDMERPRDLTAHFVKAHWVQVKLVTGLEDPGQAGSLSGDRFENVYKDMEGVDVLAGVQGFFDEGETVALTAHVNDNFKLEKWTDTKTNILSTDHSLEFLVEGPTLINLYILPARTVELSVNPAGGGTASGDGLYFLRNYVTVIGEPNDGYRWDRWTEGGEYVSSAFRYTFRLLDHRNLVANFVKTWNITTEVYPGDQSGGASGAGTFDDGAKVTLLASYNFGWRFAGWVESPGYIVSTDLLLEFEAERDRHLVANFQVWPTHLVNAVSSIEEGGYVTISGGVTQDPNQHLYEQGDSCTVRAYPNTPAYRFLGWKEAGGTDYLTTDEIYTFNVDRAYDLVAVMEKKPVYDIFVTINDEDGGSVSGADTYIEGEPATVLVTPNYGYRFVRWTEDGVEVSTANPWTFDVTEERHLVGVVEVIPVRTISVSVDPEDGGSVTGADDYLEGDTATLTASAAAGFSFVNWTVEGAEVSTSSTYSFVVTGDLHLVANFGPWDGVVYDHPDEIIPMGTGYRDPATTATSITKLANYTRVYASLSRAVAEIAWVTDGPIDLTAYSTLYIEWRNNGSSNASNQSYFGVSSNRDTNYSDLLSSYRLSKTNTFTQRTESVNIAALNGSYYIRVHARDGATSSSARTSDIYVYKIWLE